MRRIMIGLRPLALRLLVVGVISQSVAFSSEPTSDGQPIASCITRVFSGLVNSARRLELISRGLPDELKWFVLHFHDLNSGPRFPVTRRGPIRYLEQLRLWAYDFRGKKVLDVGAGKSSFSGRINQVYEATGTSAYALDLISSSTNPYEKRVQGSAFEMPFKDSEFDLVVSIWFLQNLEKGSDITKALNEMIRVTKPGGEIRVAHVGVSRRVARIAHELGVHPRVEFVETSGILPFTQAIRIQLKNQK